jgi:hypothetical protein
VRSSFRPGRIPRPGGAQHPDGRAGRPAAAARRAPARSPEARGDDHGATPWPHSFSTGPGRAGPR